MCGNMDGSVDNEFTSRNQIQESLSGFAFSFSDCSTTDYTEIDYCKFNSKVAYHFSAYLLTDPYVIYMQPLLK